MICWVILISESALKQKRNRWNFLNVIGCIDGKNIHVERRTKDRSLFNKLFFLWYNKASQILKAGSFL